MNVIASPRVPVTSAQAQAVPMPVPVLSAKWKSIDAAGPDVSPVRLVVFTSLENRLSLASGRAQRSERVEIAVSATIATIETAIATRKNHSVPERLKTLARQDVTPLGHRITVTPPVYVPASGLVTLIDAPVDVGSSIDAPRRTQPLELLGEHEATSTPTQSPASGGCTEILEFDGTLNGVAVPTFVTEPASKTSMVPRRCSPAVAPKRKKPTTISAATQ